MSLCKVFDFSIFSHDSIVKYTRGQSWVDGWYSFWYVAINTQSFWNQAFGILFFCGSFSSFFRQRTTKASTINGNAWHEWKSTSSDLYCHMMGVRNSYSKWYRNNIYFFVWKMFLNRMSIHMLCDVGIHIFSTDKNGLREKSKQKYSHNSCSTGTHDLVELTNITRSQIYVSM